MITVVTVLRSGSGFTVEQVRNLMYQERLHLFGRRVCMSDIDFDIPNVTRIPLAHPDWGWKWSKLELFRPKLWDQDELVLYLDPDVEVVGELTSIIKTRPEPMHVTPGLTSVMSWIAGELDETYRLFARTPKPNMAAHVDDYIWIKGVTVSTARFWNEVLPGKVLELTTGQPVPEGAALVYRLF